MARSAGQKSTVRNLGAQGWAQLPCGCVKVYGNEAAREGVPTGVRVQACSDHKEYEHASGSAEDLSARRGRLLAELAKIDAETPRHSAERPASVRSRRTRR